MTRDPRHTLPFNPVMFPVLGLFHTLACPEQKCSKVYCPFSHKNLKDLPPPVSLDLPAAEPLKPPPKPLVPVAVKRQIAQTSAPGPSTSKSTAREPPRKLQKTGTAQRPVAVPTTSQTAVHLEIEHCIAHTHTDIYSFRMVFRYCAPIPLVLLFLFLFDRSAS